MYRIEQTNEYIKEVQTYLILLADTDTEFPRVAIDGIYGEETKGAVIYFQKKKGLSESGTVDKDTFDLLYIDYSDAVKEKEARDFIITENGFPLAYGMRNNDVATLHFIIEELSQTYETLNPLASGRFYSRDTENSVKELQKIFGLEENGNVDALLFERLIMELTASNISRKKVTH